MKVDKALILSAGFGTRMGEIGKTLPKILWPIFDKSLLELQALYLKEMGVKDIFINLFHQKDKIIDYCKKNQTFNDVNFLIEDEILGVGGAIHNLGDKYGYKGNLLIINADQFCFFSQEIWEKAYDQINGHSCSLFATQVHQKHQYNETVLDENGYLQSIRAKGDQSGQWHLTYGGFGFINLEKLEPTKGKSDFFKSVADYKNTAIPLTVLPKDFEYWDFGTKERYFYQMHKIKSTTNSGFHKFLERCGVSIREDFYYQECDINGIVLDGEDLQNSPEYNFIKYKDIIEKININESLL